MKIFSFGVLTLLSLTLIVITISGKLSGISWLPLTACGVYFILICVGYFSLYTEYQNTSRTGSMATGVALAWIATIVGAIGVCFSFNGPDAWWSEIWSYIAVALVALLVGSIVISFQQIKPTEKGLLLLLQKSDGTISEGTSYLQWPFYQVFVVPSKVLIVNFPAPKEKLDFTDRTDAQPQNGMVFPERFVVPGKPPGPKQAGETYDPFLMELVVKMYGAFPMQIVDVSKFLKRYGTLISEGSIEQNLSEEFRPRIFALLNAYIQGKKFGVDSKISSYRDLIRFLPEIQIEIAKELNKDKSTGIEFSETEASLGAPKLPTSLQKAWEEMNTAAINVDTAEMNAEAARKKETADNEKRKNESEVRIKEENDKEMGKAAAENERKKGEAEAYKLKAQADTEAKNSQREKDTEQDIIYMTALVKELGGENAAKIMTVSELKEALKENKNASIILGGGSLDMLAERVFNFLKK